VLRLYLIVHLTLLLAAGPSYGQSTGFTFDSFEPEPAQPMQPSPSSPPRQTTPRPPAKPEPTIRSGESASPQGDEIIFLKCVMVQQWCSIMYTNRRGFASCPVSSSERVHEIVYEPKTNTLRDVGSNYRKNESTGWTVKATAESISAYKKETRKYDFDEVSDYLQYDINRVSGHYTYLFEKDSKKAGATRSTQYEGQCKSVSGKPLF